jgi:anti-sigma factor RsiW
MANDESRTPPAACQKIANLMGEYVDNTLAAAERIALESHLQMCGPCVNFLNQYRFAPQAAREALLKEVPAALESKLLAFLKSRCCK